MSFLSKPKAKAKKKHVVVEFLKKNKTKRVLKPSYQKLILIPAVKPVPKITVRRPKLLRQTSANLKLQQPREKNPDRSTDKVKTFTNTTSVTGFRNVYVFPPGKFVNTAYADSPVVKSFDLTVKSVSRTLGYNGPLYWLKVKNGEYPPFNTLSITARSQTPFVGRKITTSAGYPGVDTFRSASIGSFQMPVGYSNWPRGFENGVVSFSSAEMDACLRMAQSKTHSKIKDQAVNAAQALAERRQTIDLFATSARRLATTIAHVKRGDLAAAAKELGVSAPKRAIRRNNARMKLPNAHSEKEISRRWLELQYGWKPLLSDVFGAAEQLTKFKPYGAIRVVGKHSIYKDLTKNLFPSNQLKVTESGRAKYTVKYTVLFTVPYPSSRTLTQWGLTNPLLIAWELMPWSFVIDWFIPIGNWIQNFDSTIGCEFQAGCRTTYYIMQGARHMSQTGYDSSTASNVDLDQTMYEQDKMIGRSVLTGFPNIGYPSFKSPLSVVHCLNAIALLQLQRKK